MPGQIGSVARTARLKKWLLLIPILYGLFQVAYFGVNVVYWDEWEVVRLFNDIQTNGLTITKLFAQHNEHRIFFPRIVLLISGALTHWNVKVDMYITQVMVIVMYLVYLWHCKELEGPAIAGEKKAVFWKGICYRLVLGFCCFSAVQWQNYLWGFQVGFVMVAFAAVLSFHSYFLYLKKRQVRYLIFSLLFGVVSSFSSLQGLAVWAVYVAMFLILLIAREDSHKKSFCAVLAVGTASIVLYMRGYHSVGGHPSILGNSILDIAKYFFTVTGSIAYQMEYHGAMLFGAIISFSVLALLIWLIRHHEVLENYFSLCLIGFGFSVSGMITIGRVGFGIEQGLDSPRYTTFAMLSLIGILLIIDREFLQSIPAVKNVFEKVLCGMMALVSLATVSTGILMLHRCNTEKAFRQKISSVLENYDSNPLAELAWIYPWSNYKDAYDTIGLLEKNNFSVFYHTEYTYSPLPSTVLDGLTQVSFTRQIGIDINSWKWDSSYLYLADPWAADFYSGEQYRTVYVRINGKLYHTANHIKRTDVSTAFDNSNFTYAGFEFSIPQEQLLDGENKCSVVVVLADGVSYYETESYVLYKSAETGDLSNVNLDEVLENGTSMEITGIASSVDVQDIQESDGEISLTTSGAIDPQIIFTPLDAPVCPLVMSLKFTQVSSAASMQLFYAGADEDFSEDHSISFSITPNQTTYYLSGFLSSEIQQLRLDFGNEEGISYQIKSIKLYVR